MPNECSLSKFWEALVASKLLDAERSTELQDHFSRLPGSEHANASVAAEWLLEQAVITRYQAHLLLAEKQGPFVFGPYRIMDKAVSSVFSKRFHAIHLPTQHPVILHFWNGAVDDQQVQAQRAQVERWSAVSHASLAACYTSLASSDRIIAVTESVPGDSLSECLEGGGPIPYEDAAAIVQQLALGLHAMHQAGLVHGQVTTANVTLQDDGHVKLHGEPLLTTDVIRVGQDDKKGRMQSWADYCAPELFTDPALPSPKSDIYALGCLFFELLTGLPPFAGGTLEEKRIGHTGQRIGSLQALANAPAELQPVVEFMMAKDASIRTASCALVAEHLQPFATHNHTTATRRSTAQAFQSWLDEQKADRIRTHQSVCPSNISPLVSASTRQDVGATGTAVGDVRITDGQVRRPDQGSRLVPVSLGAAGLAVLALVIAIVWRNIQDTAPARTTPSETTRQVRPVTSEPAVRETAPTASTEIASPETLVNPQALWASPVKGNSLNLQWIPSGSPLLIAVRPASLVQLGEWDRLVSSLGPEFTQIMQRWEGVLQYSLQSADSLVLAYAFDEQNRPEPVLKIVASADSPFPVNAWGEPDQGQTGRIFHQAEVQLFQPNDQTCVVGSPSQIAEISQGTNLGLQRDLEALRATSSDQFHVNVLVTPSMLISDGKFLFSEPYLDLRRTVLNFLGDDTRAAMLSVHLDRICFAELRLVCSVEANLRTVSQLLVQKVGDSGAAMRRQLQDAPALPYWQKLAVRVPKMLDAIARQTRTGVEGRQVVANCVLPRSAAHNLLLATELRLALSGGQPTAEPNSDQREASLDQILVAQIDFSFAQQSLEFALQDLEEALRQKGLEPFSIVIKGTDLQLEGITRNQQIRNFSAQQCTVAEVLTGLVMRANPVTTVVSPTEAEQKLIWIVSPEDPTQIWVTTRAAAASRNWALPQVFVTQ